LEKWGGGGKCHPRSIKVGTDEDTLSAKTWVGKTTEDTQKNGIKSKGKGKGWGSAIVKTRGAGGRSWLGRKSDELPNELDPE